MEDSQPICETEQASFCVELLKRLNTQRRQGQLCDIILVAKKGKEFKAHRNVLSAASPFFAKLLQSDMREKEEGVIRFEEISASILEEILEFVYTGHVEIDDEGKAKDLIMAADYLLLLCLKTIATRYLEERLTIFNCVSTFYLAEKYQCYELVAQSRALILDNFASVAGFDEFLNLEAKEVGSWISSDEICVAAEEDVFKIIQQWIEQNEIDRKAKFEELFGHVRPVFLSRDSLLDVVTHNLVRENHSCLEKVLDAIAIVNGASEDDNMQSPRRSLGTEAIVARGGKHTLCYLPQRDEWKFLADGQYEHKTLSSEMIIFRDQLFTFDGVNRAERYDPVLDSWSPMQHMQFPSFSKRVVVVRGQIYAIDVDEDTNESTIERYNVKSWSWESILTSHEGCRYGCCVVPAGNCIYVLGGSPVRLTGGCVTKADRFDTVKNKWEQISDMQEARGDAFGVATQGKIFVAGGISSSYYADFLQTCEMYIIATNEWQFIARLNVPRFWGSMVCVNGTLYVLGGQVQSWTPEYSIESYDPTVNKWTQKTSIPVDKIPEDCKSSFSISFKGCAMKVPKAVLERPFSSIQHD